DTLSEETCNICGPQLLYHVHPAAAANRQKACHDVRDRGSRTCPDAAHQDSLHGRVASASIPSTAWIADRPAPTPMRVEQGRPAMTIRANGHGATATPRSCRGRTSRVSSSSSCHGAPLARIHDEE